MKTQVSNGDADAKGGDGSSPKPGNTTVTTTAHLSNGQDSKEEDIIKQPADTSDIAKDAVDAAKDESKESANSLSIEEKTPSDDTNEAAQALKTLSENKTASDTKDVQKEPTDTDTAAESLQTGTQPTSNEVGGTKRKNSTEDKEEEGTESDVTKPFAKPPASLSPGMHDADKQIKKKKKTHQADIEIGTKIFKRFLGFGDFVGEVIEFCERTNLYRVKYPDGDREQMTPDEIRRFAQKYKKHAESATESGRSPRRRSASSQINLGLHVMKSFPEHGDFVGEVIEFDQNEKLYRIEYSDGDREQMTKIEVLKFASKYKKHQKAKELTT